MKNKSLIFISTLLVSGFLVVGCSAQTDNVEQPTKPDTDYSWEENNVPLTDDLKPTDITLIVNESSLPVGFTKETQTQEEVGSGIAPPNNESDKTINFVNSDKTCFLGFNVYGQPFAEDVKDYTKAAVDGQIQYMSSPEISAATLNTDKGEPLEFAVVSNTEFGTTSFIAVRAFDVDVPTSTLTESGEPATGKRVLAVSYSCDEDKGITAADFQNVLNAVTISYTTS